MRNLTYLLLISFLPMFSLAEISIGNVEDGQKAYKKCAVCHQIGEDAKNVTGPVLNNIIGQKPASAEGFEYSDALKEAANNGMIWTVENIDAFLADPDNLVPNTRMSFAGISDPSERANIIAFLTSLADQNSELEFQDQFEVSKEVLAIEGDREYGEYLSSECITCHQANGGDEGIPSIIGWNTENFVTVMHAYREKYRENPVMQLVAGRLSDEEIAALAAYFNNID